MAASSSGAVVDPYRNFRQVSRPANPKQMIRPQALRLLAPQSFALRLGAI